MNNRIQQRFDKSIREAVEETKRVRERESAKRGRPVKPLAEEPSPKLGRMVLLLDPEDGATVLVPYDHPLAVAKRRELRASADVSCHSTTCSNAIE